MSTIKYQQRSGRTYLAGRAAVLDLRSANWSSDVPGTSSPPSPIPPSLLPPSQTYIAPVSLISVILSVIQALLQCRHKCVFNVINDSAVVGQMAATLPRRRNVKSGARNDERGAGRQIWGQVLLNLQGDVAQISQQLPPPTTSLHRLPRPRFLNCLDLQPQ